MLKNKEVKELIIIEIFILLIGFVSILLLNKYSYNVYKESIIENNLYIIDSIITKYPTLENDVINSIINNNGIIDLVSGNKDGLIADDSRYNIYELEDNMLVKKLIYDKNWLQKELKTIRKR